MTQVVSIFGGPTGEPRPSEACIQCLERLLEMAKAGEITGVAAASVHHDGTASFDVSGFVGGYSLMGALEMARSSLVEINRE